MPAVAGDHVARRRLTASTFLAAAAVVLLTGWLVLVLQGRPASSASPGKPDPVVEDTRTAAEPPTAFVPAPPVGPGFVPERLRFEALGIDAPVVPLVASDRVLTPPADPTVLGWWAAGARPGAAEGTALLTGHTVHTGGGDLDDLEQAGVGDRIELAGSDGSRDASYVVIEVLVLGKGELAERAADLFAPSGPPRLVIVTCEDWNGSSYDSNVVVVATPVPE